MKIIFFGSDDFAATHLEQILANSNTVVACVTQPDKPKGRGLVVDISPIKLMAQAHSIPVLQPSTLKDPAVVDHLRGFNADVFVVVAYGQILTQSILDIPKIFCINVHGSLLPKYRGAAPINWAIMNGDEKTGVTVQKMELALDSGAIIAQQEMPISLTTDARQLRLQMAEVGAKLLVKTLPLINQPGLQCQPQDPTAVSYAPKLSKEMGRINWSLSAIQLDRLWRGLQPWPGVYSRFKGKMIKVHEAKVVEATGGVGEIVSIDREGLTVACGVNALKLIKVQPEAGKIMPAFDFAQGYQVKVGNIFEN